MPSPGTTSTLSIGILKKSWLELSRVKRRDWALSQPNSDILSICLATWDYWKHLLNPQQKIFWEEYSLRNNNHLKKIWWCIMVKRKNKGRKQAQIFFSKVIEHTVILVWILQFFYQALFILLNFVGWESLSVWICEVRSLFFNAWQINKYSAQNTFTLALLHFKQK